MSEIYPERRPTRGRRDPRLAAELAAAQAYNGDIELVEAPPEEDEASSEVVAWLSPGDRVLARVTHPINITGEPSWFTYQVIAQVAPGETESDVFERVAPIVTSRAVELSIIAENDLVDRQNEANQARVARRTPDPNRRVTPRG